MISQAAQYILPGVLFVILFFALIKKVPAYDCFLEGATDGAKMAIKLLPSLVGLITATEMLKASGALDILTSALLPVAKLLGLPQEVMPLFLLHPVSGSGASAILTQILRDHGPDGYIGRVASVLCGSAETTLYAVTIYYGSCGIKNIRYTLKVALLADLAAAIFSGVAVRLFF